jgi:integrase
MTIPYGHRFEAIQALRQTLQRAVSRGMLNSNPAKQGVENRQRPRVEHRPFDSWEQIRALADRTAARCRPLVLFAAATGPRPSERIALEHRDIDRQARIVYVRRTYRNGRLKCPKK